MNQLEGQIATIEVSGSLSLVHIKVSESLTFKAIIIETPESASYLRKDNPIKVLFKETEVVIGTREDHAISLQNRISGKVIRVERGALISKVTLHTEVGEIASVISTNSVDRLGLKEDSAVVAMVKLNEVMLSV